MPTSDRSFFVRDFGELFIYEEKQMTTLTYSAIGASSTPTITWESINWTKVIIGVKKLQMRIAKAVRERRYGKVKALQWILTHSFTAKLLAVKRVTQNQGKNTPGVDGLVWRTPQQKIKAVQSLKRRGYCVQPLRRVWIPKRAGKKTSFGNTNYEGSGNAGSLSAST
ncbi:reverse transcriptase N-terminal domain-containing protein [Wolbachia endosymbiont (group A) of Clivina fossor]|uniref:reverse transcriptase N-terminal domain-containing protein n=1 Tax=Wolbachia endosymbiont (group A) of Clivina fossor TaxID=3066133 RepID=UPI003132AD93